MDPVQTSVDKVREMKRETISNLKLFVKSRSAKLPREAPEEGSSSASTPSPPASSVEGVPEPGDSRHGGLRKLDDVGDHRLWTPVSPSGIKPAPRFSHAAAVVGRKMLVIGGEAASGPLNDVQLLHLGKLNWCEVGVGASSLSTSVRAKSGSVQQLPFCKGHSLISWGKTVLLIAGQMDPPSDTVTVWSFDLEMDSWTKVTTKGEIPFARSGQTVTRAGSILIMFGGEDLKGRKLNDLHILDLKSLMWLPLHTSGTGPSPRARHVAEMYDDRFLLIFGGASKSKPLNDLYALDFETMEWSRLKTKGVIPSHRVGHAGTLVGDKWYIAGGESRGGNGTQETIALDVARMTWSVVSENSDSILSNQGLSIILVQRKERVFLVAFGGCGAEASNYVYVMFIPQAEHASSRNTAGLLRGTASPDGFGKSALDHANRQQSSLHATLMGASLPCTCVSVAKSNLVPVWEHRAAAGICHSGTPSEDQQNIDPSIGLIPLRKKYAVAREVSKELNGNAAATRLGSKELPTKYGKMRWPEPSSMEASQRPHHQVGRRVADELPLSPPSVRPTLLSGIGDNFTSHWQNPSNSKEDISDEKSGSSSSSLDSYSSTKSTSFTVQSPISGLSSQLLEEDDVHLMSQICNGDSLQSREQALLKYKRLCERRLGAAMRKQELIAGQLAEALTSKHDAENMMQSVMSSCQAAEGKLSLSLKERKELKDTVMNLEHALQESKKSSNLVHCENLRREDEIAYLKAALEDKKKEVQATRGVIASERARNFKLQVQVFELRQKLQSIDQSPQVLPSYVSQPILA